MMQEFLRILNVEPSATVHDIKKAWRDKCLIHHPDKGGDPNKFREVTHAYRMLTDASYRLGKLDKGPSRDADLTVVKNIPFEEGFFGTKVVFSYSRLVLDNNLKPIDQKTLEIINYVMNIPPGTTGVFQCRVPGYGIKIGDHIGCGVFQAAVSSSQRYSVVGSDVITKEEIPLKTLICGGEIDILTLWGIKKCKIPPGSDPTSCRFAIRNAGVSKYGNHYVVPIPIFPSVAELRSPEWEGLNFKWESPEITNQDDLFMGLFDQLVK